VSQSQRTDRTAEQRRPAPARRRTEGEEKFSGAMIDLRLMTNRLRAARFPEQGVDIFAAGNLRVRRDEMVAPLALAHYRARLIKRLSEVSRVPECRVEERIAEIGPFYLVLAAERRVIGIGRGDHQGVVVRKRANENT